jgi:hypothetical protein
LPGLQSQFSRRHNSGLFNADASYFNADQDLKLPTGRYRCGAVASAVQRHSNTGKLVMIDTGAAQ